MKPVKDKLRSVGSGSNYFKIKLKHMTDEVHDQIISSITATVSFRIEKLIFSQKDNLLGFK